MCSIILLMAEGDSIEYSSIPKAPPVRVIDSIGLAEKLLGEKGNLEPYNSYMLLSTSKKTYPDELVLAFSSWASQHSPKFMLVIADGMQIYNKLAVKGLNPQALTDEQYHKFNDEMAEYARAARKRKRELNEFITRIGFTNVNAVLYSELLENIANLDPWVKHFIVSTREMHYEQDLDPVFDKKIKEATQKSAAHILAKSQGNPEIGEFVASLYTREQEVLAITLATINYQRYRIKIGPESERVYDEIAKDILEHGFGTLRMTYDTNELSTFGVVYLQLEDSSGQPQDTAVENLLPS